MKGFSRSGRRPAFFGCRGARVVVLQLLLLGLWATPSRSCPFCLFAPQSIAEQVDRADLVIVAELVQFRVLDFGQRAESRLRIREYLKGSDIAEAHSSLAVGQCLTISADFSAKPGDLFLMYGECPVPVESSDVRTFAFDRAAVPDTATSSVIQADGQSFVVAGAATIRKISFLSPELISWNDTTAVSPETVEYLRQLPDMNLPQRERLTFFVRFLEHSDPLIAIDAWSEFGNSSYEDVASIKALLSREDLRRWIADPQMTPERLGLYGMMLGLCGTAEDADFLERAIGDPRSAAYEYRFGSDGMMAGYLMLSGEAGLEYLEATRILPAQPSSNESLCLLQALQFMRDYQHDTISQDRLVQSVRLLLQHEAIREQVIASLSRWSDWSSLPVLIEMFDKECSEDRMARLAVLQFAHTCEQTAKTSDSPSPHAREAAEFLERTRQRDPELMSRFDSIISR